MPAKRSFTLALALLLVAAIPARASAFPEITVIDINTGNSGADGSYPYEFAALDDYLYFNAEGDTHGRELWRTNGTTTELVEDINTNGTSGADSSYPFGFTALGDYLYFSAGDGTHGRELWRTNGTTTEIVEDINTTGADSSNPSGFTALGDYLYFSADDGTHGQELWRTNGTTITELVENINLGTSGADSSNPLYFTVFNGYLYFNANDGTHAQELWRTNGTTTALVEDINTNGTDFSDPYDFTALNGYLYFSANDGTHGRELWRTNGTELGTTLVANINTNGTDGVDSSSLGAFTAFGEWVYFGADDGTVGSELWRTNGTTTEIVEDINTTGADSSAPYGFTAFNGYLYFQADDGAHGPELWRTNGTELGTTLVQDINIGTGGADGSYPYVLTALGDYLYFLRGADTVNNLWRIGSSGLAEWVSPPGTNPNFSCECQPLNALNGRLYMYLGSDETGGELAYLDEPTFVLPPTNRDGSVWSTALVLLAALTAVAGVGLRLRKGSLAK